MPAYDLLAFAIFQAIIDIYLLLVSFFALIQGPPWGVLIRISQGRAASPDIVLTHQGASRLLLYLFPPLSCYSYGDCGGKLQDNFLTFKLPQVGLWGLCKTVDR